MEEALAAGAAAHEIQSLLIAELELPPQPTVLVLEDVHWADDATLDSITVLGRRVASLPALLVLTFRGGEAPPAHPLRAALGAISAGDSMFLELAPLSEQAVAALAGDDTDDVYAATAGNPFYVTELLGSRPAATLPPSVANAVLGRASRLEDDAWRLVQLVSVVPNRAHTSLLDAVMPGWLAAAEEPERRQLLEVDGKYVRFRHELARNAIRSSLPLAAQRRLHAEILAALLAADADPADIVHHAEAAGADDVVADYALVAARRAAALASNREAYSHYRRASDFVDRLPLVEQAAVLEELANAAYVIGRIEHAFPAIERAIALFGDLDDIAAVGRCTRVLSRFHWFAGDGEAAQRKALEAIAILEPLGESAELARAYSGLSQLAMLAENAEQAFDWGERALELAIRLGDESTRAHALINIGTAKVQLDHRETETVLEAHAIADAAGDWYEATRALVNLAYTEMLWVRPAAALRHAEQARRLRPAARDPRPRLLHRHDDRVASAPCRGVGGGRARDAKRVRARPHRRPADRQHGPGRAGRAAGRSRCGQAVGRPRGSGRSHGRAAAARAGRRAGDGVGVDARHADAGRAVRQADREDPAADQVRRLGCGRA